MTYTVLPPTLPAYLASRVIFDPATGCLTWLAGHSSQGAYPVLFRDGTCKYAHRLAFEAAYGPLSNGQEAHHICLNRSCINPLHIQAVTRKQHLAIHKGLRAGKRIAAEALAA